MSGLVKVTKDPHIYPVPTETDASISISTHLHTHMHMIFKNPSQQLCIRYFP